MTWTETVNQFLTDSDRTASTIAQYRRALNEFHRWYLDEYEEDPAPSLLTDEEAREWRDHLSNKRKLSASTVNMRLAALRGLCRSYDNKIAVTNMRQTQKPVEVLSGRDLGRLFKAAQGDGWMDKRNVAMLAMLARAGLRAGEVVALDRDDMEINERSGWATVHRGKGRKERRVPLSLETRNALGEYKKVRPEDAESPALFVSQNGHRLNVQDVERMLAGAAQEARIKKRVYPHLLRHTFATRFLKNAGERGLKALQMILGHTQITTTARYLHPDAKQLQDMVEGL
jgi:site-specific recombinase XerD